MRYVEDAIFGPGSDREEQKLFKERLTPLLATSVEGNSKATQTFSFLKNGTLEYMMVSNLGLKTSVESNP